jgi:hypothetical protein
VQPNTRKHMGMLPLPFTGSFLVVPAGIYMADQSTPPVPTTYIYARGDLCSRSDL